MQQRARVRQIPCDMFLLPKRWEKKCNFPCTAGERSLTEAKMRVRLCAKDKFEWDGHVIRGLIAEDKIPNDEELPARALSDTGTAPLQRGAEV